MIEMNVVLITETVVGLTAWLVLSLSLSPVKQLIRLTKGLFSANLRTLATG
jgi:hypothetical protein